MANIELVTTECDVALSRTGARARWQTFLSGDSDAMAMIAILVLTVAFCLALALAVCVDKFVAGFVSATIIWKWHDWIYKPVDAWLNRLWAKENQS